MERLVRLTGIFTVSIAGAYGGEFRLSVMFRRNTRKSAHMLVLSRFLVSWVYRLTTP